MSANPSLNGRWTARRALGKLLRDARLALGLTQKAVAKAMGPGVYESKLSLWESGREIPSEPYMEELVRVLGLDRTRAVLAYYEASLERGRAIRQEAIRRQGRRPDPDSSAPARGQPRTRP